MWAVFAKVADVATYLTTNLSTTRASKIDRLDTTVSGRQANWGATSTTKSYIDTTKTNVDTIKTNLATVDSVVDTTKANVDTVKSNVSTMYGRFGSSTTASGTTTLFGYLRRIYEYMTSYMSSTRMSKVDRLDTTVSSRLSAVVKSYQRVYIGSVKMSGRGSGEDAVYYNIPIASVNISKCQIIPHLRCGSNIVSALFVSSSTLFMEPTVRFTSTTNIRASVYSTSYDDLFGYIEVIEYY